MSAGSPHAARDPISARADAAQAREIRGMLARGIPPATIAAACGIGIARVHTIAAQAPEGDVNAPLPSPAAVALPTPRRPTTRPTPATATAPHTSWDALLARAAHIDDPRITAHVDHILADLADLIADIRIWDDRERAAQALVDADRRAALLARSYTERHPSRRHSDRTPTQEATA